MRLHSTGILQRARTFIHYHSILQLLTRSHCCEWAQCGIWRFQRKHTGYHNACDADFAAAIRLCYILTVGHVPHVQIDLQFSSTIPTNHRFWSRFYAKRQHTRINDTYACGQVGSQLWFNWMVHSIKFRTGKQTDCSLQISMEKHKKSDSL